MKLAAVLALAALSACGVIPEAPSRIANDLVAPAGAVPVLVYRPQDERLVCTNKRTRRTMPGTVCGGAAVADDPPGTPQVPMMIYSRTDAIHLCVNFLNMELLAPWRCT